MTQVEWKFQERGVEVGGAAFKLREDVTAERVLEFADGLRIATRVRLILSKAIGAYGDGTADYAGAAKKLAALIPEYEAASDALTEKGAAFASFFEPEGVLGRFESDVKARSEFVRQAIEAFSRS